MKKESTFHVIPFIICLLLIFAGAIAGMLQQIKIVEDQAKERELKTEITEITITTDQLSKFNELNK